MAEVKPGTDAHVAHLGGTKRAVREVGGTIAARARASLAAHKETGAASIEVHREDTDTVVSLVDPHGAAHAIELGGTRKDGRVIQGLFILTNAAKL